MKNYFNHKFVLYALSMVIVVVQLLLSTNNVQAGTCADLSFIKSGKVITQTTVPAKDSAKYQVKAVIKGSSKTSCKDSYVRIGVIFVDQLNKAKPISYILPATKIPPAGLTKTFTFTTTDPQGIYTYTVETYNITSKDISKPDGNSTKESLSITLGQAGKATTSTASKPNTPENTDYQALQTRTYAGKDWDGSLSILKPLKINGQEATDISQVASKLINWLLLVISLVATIMIVYAGVLLVFNGGNESQYKKARTIITWAVIGLVVSLSAFAIVNIIQSLLQK